MNKILTLIMAHCHQSVNLDSTLNPTTIAVIAPAPAAVGSVLLGPFAISYH